MKKLIYLFLICVLCIPIFAACDEALPEEVIGDAAIESKIVTLNEDYEVLQLTIAENEPGKKAIVYVDEEDEDEDDYFFATDAEGVCYRVEFNSLYNNIIGQGVTVYITYTADASEEVNESDHGFTPRYSIDPRSIWSAKAWELKEIANEKASEAFDVPASALRLDGCYMVEYGKYEFSYRAYIAGIVAGSPRLYLKENGEIERVDLGYKGELMKYIGTGIERAIPTAKKSLQEQTGEENPGFYLDEDEDGYVYLCTEIIKHLSPDDPRYGKVGCEDHEHLFYREKLGKAIEDKTEKE